VASNPNRPSKRKTPTPRATSFEPAAAKAFGQVVRTVREGQGLAQDKFALLANVDRSYYGKLERGERQPSLGLLLRIAKALGVPGASLVEETETHLRRLRRAEGATVKR
jgi:transcriptional regulator with XRE-family HTH domain